MMGEDDLPPAETRVMLPPDEEDIRMVLHGTLPRCPCCQGTPTTFARHFPASGIYQAYVHCSHCDVQVFKNARDLDEARHLAIATWSKRPTPPDNSRQIAASLNSLADRCKPRGVARGLRVAADHVKAGLWEDHHEQN